ncbi:MAG: EamA family transporter [Clostridia bacterium]|nr:EamA family transporter [Clostridia bacterium]
MKTKAFIYIILAGVLWGTSGLFVHALAPYGFTTPQMSAVRAVVSFAGLALFALIRDRSLFRIKPTELLLFAVIGASLFATGTCYFTSMQLTSVATAVILMYTAPIYVAIYSMLFLGERFSRLKLAAIIGMLIGCALVAGVVGGMRFDAVGILLGVCSGIAYAAYNILTKIAIRRGSRPATATLYSVLFMALVALTVSQPQHILTHASASPALIIALMLALGLVTHFIPYLLYATGMRDLPAGTASALGIVEPMAATLFGMWLLGDRLDVFSYIGIALILLATLLLSRTEALGKE